MVLGRRELSAILLAIAAILVYLVLLSTTPSGAQTGGGTTGGNVGCPNPQPVQTFTGSQSQITPSFQITGNTFRLSLEANLVQAGEFGDIFIDSVDEGTGLAVPFGGIQVNPVEGPTNQSANVLEGPGTFSLRIQSTNVQYTITVEDCTGSNQTTTNPINPSNQGGVTAIANPPRKPQRERTVVNVPNKPLPPSGGLPVYGIVVSSILAGTGLLALGLVIRCGSRR